MNEDTFIGMLASLALTHIKGPVPCNMPECPDDALALAVEQWIRTDTLEQTVTHEDISYHFDFTTIANDVFVAVKEDLCHAVENTKSPATPMQGYEP